MANIFRRRSQRTAHIGANEPRSHSHGQHISWSDPLVTQSLAPDPGQPQAPISVVPERSYAPHGLRTTRGVPHHRSLRPRQGILRATQQSAPHQPSAYPHPGTRVRPNAPETPHHTPYMRRRNSMPFLGGWCGQPDNRSQRRNSTRRTPCNSQFSPFHPPPAPVYPTFPVNCGAQQSNAYPFQPQQTPMITPSRAMPQLPHERPSLTQWNFPAGTLAWTPHPAPHPNVPSTAFWNSGTALQGLPQTASRQSSNTPLDPWHAARLTGGWPLPGADPRWTPGTWPPAAWGASVPVRLAPCLIPNPANPNMPQLVWDISQNPAGARRITGAHTIIPLSSQFNQQALVPATDEVHIAVQSPYVQRLWGSIKVTTSSKVTVWDILSAIYEFFQIQLTQAEVNHIQSFDQRNYDILVEACRARCNITPALPDFERLQGLKRIDILGDKRGFWGLWLAFDDFSNSWHLNLGLIDLRPGLPR